jgi:hypothetical protein
MTCCWRVKDPGTCRIHPTHTGDYIINMMWSGEHIPGSPFSLTVTDREEEGVNVVGAINECYSVNDGENLQEGITFF